MSIEVCKLRDKPADCTSGTFLFSFCDALVTQVLMLEFTWQVAELLEQNSSAVRIRCPFVQAEANLERVIDTLSAIHFRAPVHRLPEASAHWGFAQSPREADTHGYLEVHARTYCKAVLNDWVYYVVWAGAVSPTGHIVNAGREGGLTFNPHCLSPPLLTLRARTFQNCAN